MWREGKPPARPLRLPFSPPPRSPPDSGAAPCRRRRPKSVKRSSTPTTTGLTRPQVRAASPGAGPRRHLRRPPGRRPPAGPGARAGGAGRGGAARPAGARGLGALFCARPGRGPGWRRGGGRRCEAGALRPARRGRRRPPLPLPPPSLSSPSLPPEKPLFIVLRHDASLPSAAAAATWCGRTRPRARPPARFRFAPGPRRRPRHSRPEAGPGGASAWSWGWVGARGARGRPRAGPWPAGRMLWPAWAHSPRGAAAPSHQRAEKPGAATSVSGVLEMAKKAGLSEGGSRQGGCQSRDGYRK